MVIVEKNIIICFILRIFSLNLSVQKFKSGIIASLVRYFNLHKLAKFSVTVRCGVFPFEALNKLRLFILLKMNNETKVCTRCKKEKVITEFSRHCRKKDNRTSQCKSCKSEIDREYQNRPEIKAKKKLYDKERSKKAHVKIQQLISIENQRFGFSATEYVQGKVCEYCGMTNEQHKEKFNQRLQIHHKDGNGRKAQREGKPINNNPDNLMIVCRPCHCKIENKEFQEYDGRGKKIWVKIRENQKVRTVKALCFDV